jgi:NADPH:quinone reductase-like Zn-dependent oxidoreductase
MKMTNAIRFHDYGGPEVMKLEQIPLPVPQADEILVRVHAMGVNPADWKIREGLFRKRINIPLPAIPGGDISGVIEQVGAEAKGVSVGQPVFAMIGLLGAYAEHVAIKPGITAPKPANLDHMQAASVPLAALTAWKGLFELGGLERGQRVLIHAAAGGVGSFAVQLARNAGAKVVGTASADNVAYLSELGADEVIDYRKGSFEAHAHGFDVILDLISGETGARSLQLLKKGGIHVGVLPPPEPLLQQAEAAGLRVAAVQVVPDGGRLREIGKLIEAGKVRTTVAAVFPLEQAAQAHEESKKGHTRGKIVLKSIG